MNRRIVLASDNVHKFKEFSSMLAGVCKLLPQIEFQIKTPVEDGNSFEENACLKAVSACQQLQMPVLADDSGLEVMALQGAPGIFSARYAGSQASDRDNLEKLLADTAHLDDTQLEARFCCTLAYAQDHNQAPLVVKAYWNGRLLRQPQGESGFGYDPIFYVPEYEMTAAQLEPEIKNRISHRGQALAKLKYLLSNL